MNKQSGTEIQANQTIDSVDLEGVTGGCSQCGCGNPTPAAGSGYAPGSPSVDPRFGRSVPAIGGGGGAGGFA
jgi:hypothetical protein